MSFGRVAVAPPLKPTVLRTCNGDAMSDLAFFESYEGQTLDELIELEQRYRIDSLVLACEAALQQKAERNGAESLTEPERIILTIEALEREVNNGGYHQFFFNSSKEYTPNVVQALQAIGCPKLAETTRRAISILGLPPDASPDEIDAELDARGDELISSLDACDNQYYANVEENIEARLFEFIKKNRATISLQ